MDVRNVIGLLLVIYGVILTGMGLFGDKQLEKTGDINANLIGGICLLIAGGIFLAWARFNPMVEVEHDHSIGEIGDDPGHNKHAH